MAHQKVIADLNREILETNSKQLSLIEKLNTLNFNNEEHMMSEHQKQLDLLRMQLTQSEQARAGLTQDILNLNDTIT